METVTYTHQEVHDVDDTCAERKQYAKPALSGNENDLYGSYKPQISHLYYVLAQFFGRHAVVVVHRAVDFPGPSQRPHSKLALRPSRNQT